MYALRPARTARCGRDEWPAARSAPGRPGPAPAVLSAGRAS